MKPRRRRKIATAVILALLALPTASLVLLASPAAATTNTSTSTAQQVGLICPQGTANTQNQSLQSANNDLPVNRWSGSLGNEHTRLPGGLFGSIASAPSTIDRQVFIGGMTSISSAEWDLGIAATSGASSFCMANSVGADANSLAANLGNGIIQSPLVAVLAVIGLITVLWKAMRGADRPLKQLIKTGAVVGALVTVVGAATVSSSSGSGAILSPEWLITRTYSAVNSVASAPALALSSAAQKVTGGGNQQKVAANDPLSCYWYDQELVKQYQTAYQNQGSGAYVVPTSLNSLWEQAALPAYISEQFGNSNNYGPLIYCHLLEDQAGTSPLTQMQTALASGTLSGDPGLSSFARGHVTGTGSSAGTQWSALAWNGALTNDQEDESMLGWAACQSPASGGSGSGGSGFTPSEYNVQTGQPLTSGFATIGNPNDSGATVTGRDCQVFWAANAPASGGQFGDAKTAGSPFANPASAPWSGQISNPDYGVFNWSDNWQTITGGTSSTPGLNAAAGSTTNTSASGMENFLGNLHGNTNGGAEATAFIFLLASTVIMLIFLVLGLAVIIAKLSLVIWMVAMPLMLLLWLIPSMSSKFTKYLKHLFGLMLFSTGVGMILSFVAIITNIVSSLATTSFGVGSVFSLIFLAISPVVAVWMVHKLFKMMKLPSPFSPTGAAAFAGSMGGLGSIGGGVLGADLFSHLSRGGRMATSYATGAAKSTFASPSATRNGPRGAVRSTSRTGSSNGSGSASGWGAAGTGAAAAGSTARATSPTTSPSVDGPTTSPQVGGDTSVTRDLTGAVASEMAQERTQGAGRGPAAPITPSEVAAQRSSRGRRNPRPWETEQALANRHARQQTIKKVGRAHTQMVGSLLNPGSLAEAAKARAAAKWETARDRFNAKDDHGPHRIKGSLKTAGAVARTAGRGARLAAPRVVKYGAAGAGTLAIGAFGAVPLAAAGALYGAHKLNRHYQRTPQRAAHRIESYRQHIDAQEAQRKADEAARTSQAKDLEQRASDEASAREEAQRRADKVERKAERKAQRGDEARARQNAADELLVRQRESEWVSGRPSGALDLETIERIWTTKQGERDVERLR